MISEYKMRWEKLVRPTRLKSEERQIASIDLKEDPFEADYDVIVFSQPFRRLKDKTQVYPLSENDHVRTRLSHSLEAACIGQYLGYAAGRFIIDEYQLDRAKYHPLQFGGIVKAACLAHDIGHPPLGHIGEQAIRDWFRSVTDGNLLRGLRPSTMQDLRSFEGNAQGFRILTQLENHRGEGGLRLTHPTLAAMMKYPWGSNHSNYKRPKEEGGGKIGYFEPEQEYAKETAQAVGLVPDGEGGWYRHPLAYLVEAADDIAYRIVDLEDGVDMGDLSFEEFETLFTDFLHKVLKTDASSMVRDLDRLNDPNQRVSYLRSRAMVVLADQVVHVFREKEESIVEGKLRYSDPVPKAKVFYRPLLGEIQDTDTRNFIDTIGQIPKERIYDGSRKLYTEITYYRVIHGLLDAFSKAVLAPEFVKHEHLKKLMGRDKPEPSWSRDDILRGVVDFVSGMTDRFALGMFRQLEGISLGNMTPAPLRRMNLKQKDVGPETA